MAFYWYGWWWWCSPDVTVMWCGVVCLAAMTVYVSYWALIQNHKTLHPLLLLTYTHTHAYIWTHTHQYMNTNIFHLQWAGDVDLCGQRYKCHTVSPCFTFHVCGRETHNNRERESLQPSSTPCEVDQGLSLPLNRWYKSSRCFCPEGFFTSD